MLQTKEKTQEIAERLIREELLTNQTALVCDLINENGQFYTDTISNLYINYCNQCGHADRMNETTEGDACHICNDGEFELESQDVMQWYAVTNYLAKELENIGEPVIMNDYGNWWGRTCYGQAIIADGTFQQIAERIQAR